MFEEALAVIRRYDRIILHRHKNPDGDALGSQIGLKELIRVNFPEKTVLMVGDPTVRYAFMNGWEPDEVPDEAYKGALAVILDSSTPDIVSDARFALAGERLRFDHHIFMGAFAETEAVDTSYESCCGLLTDFALQSGLRITPAAAEALFTGMVTDSGRFRYDSTTPRTLRLAAALLETGIDTNELYRRLYEEDPVSLKRRAHFIEKIRFTPARTAYLKNTKEEVAALGMDAFSVSRGMVGTMADLKGVSVWVNFTEADEGIFCEIRSGKYNINPVAVKYGGGGHAKASGATVPDWETADAMLRDLDRYAEEDHE